jgi:ribosome-associated translation inhibitor RaiA
MAAVRKGMQIEFAFRGMAPSHSAEMAARRWIERLERAYAQITSCKVVIEQPHQHHSRGNAFHVRVEVAVPDDIISVSHAPGDEATHDDVYVAISDAFRAARRQLLNYVAHRRDGKHYAASL